MQCNELTAQNKRENMKYRLLGKTGLEVSVLSFGELVLRLLGGLKCDNLGKWKLGTTGPEPGDQPTRVMQGSVIMGQGCDKILMVYTHLMC